MQGADNGTQRRKGRKESFLEASHLITDLDYDWKGCKARRMARKGAKDAKNLFWKHHILLLIWIMIGKTENELAKIVVDLCLKIHRTLGPGLLESVYEEVLCYELKKLGLRFTRQQVIAVVYEGITMDLGFRTDVIVEDKLIVELKSVETVAPVHYKILLTYLRLTDKRLGLMVNFNEVLIRDGIRRVVNDL
jgi:GxxExxY protein